MGAMQVVVLAVTLLGQDAPAAPAAVQAPAAMEAPVAMEVPAAPDAPCCGPWFGSDAVGRWKGTWSSETSDHRGPLRAKIRRCHYGQYRAKFSGRFYGVIPFIYTVPLTTTSTSPDGVTRLVGERKLPFFGTFHCEAEVTGCEFLATFHAANDHGRFEMRRVAPK